MRALTLQRPWAAAFLLPTDPKRIENRKWKPPASIIGQRIALHSGLGWWPEHDRIAGAILDGDDERRCWMRLCDMKGVFATALVSGYVHEWLGELWSIGNVDAQSVRASRWWLGPYAWVLTDFVALEQSIECRGAQGLWKLPADVEALVDDDCR